PRARVIGLDPWLGGLRRGMEKRRFHRLDHLHFVGGDGARLPFADDTFDLVVMNLGLNNFAEPEAVVAECARVLDPDGRLILTTNPRGHMIEIYDELRQVLEALGDADALGRLEHHESHRGTRDTIAATLAAGGFTVTNVIEDRFTMRFTDGDALLRHP